MKKMKRVLLGVVLLWGAGGVAQAQTPQTPVVSPAPAVKTIPPLDNVPEVPVPPQDPVLDWTYAGGNGPSRWATIRPPYHACGNGRKQSPVNIAKFYQDDLPPLDLTYHAVPLSLINTGRTVLLPYPDGSGFMADGLFYALRQIVFHTPSEHYIDGAPYPVEVQLIHRADDGTQAIVSVMMKVGKNNPVLAGILQNVPVQTFAQKTVPTVKYSARGLMPQTLEHYRYEGSLTVPPCSEGVIWFVMKTPLEISEEQIRAFQGLFPVNARPIQPLNDRVITGD